MNGSVVMRDAAAGQRTAPSIAPGPAELVAEGLTLRTRRGPVYEDVGLTLERAGLGVLTGPSGAGKTALLLTLAGRMRFTGGTATVCGLDVRRDARSVRRLVGLGIIPGITDLDDTTTIAAQVRAELTLHRLAHDERAVHDLLGRFELEAHPDAEIGSLGKGEQLLLGIGLGLIHSPRVLMVDGVDTNLTAAEQTMVWAALRRVCDGGVTVLATSLDDPPDAQADLVVRMPVGGER
jgi:ABC-type multidrug transport system ATPase subunit